MGKTPHYQCMSKAAAPKQARSRQATEAPRTRASIHCNKHQRGWQTMWSRHVLQDQHAQPDR